MADLETTTVCPEHSEDLVGAPMGMYHCPACGCMTVAGLPHFPHTVGCDLGLENECPHGDAVEYCPACRETAGGAS